MSSCSDSHGVQKQCAFNCCSSFFFFFFLDLISLFMEQGASPYGLTVSVVVVVVVVVLLARG